MFLANNPLLQFNNVSFEGCSHEDILFDSSAIQNGMRFTLTFEKNCELSLLKLNFHLKKESQRIVSNGFQSWSACLKTAEETQQKKLRRIASPLMGNSGDYKFYPYRNSKGIVHGWHYTNGQLADGNYFLIGALSPQIGYTAFEWNTQAEIETLNVQVFTERIFKKGETLEFELFAGFHATEQQLFANYFEQYPEIPVFKEKKKFTGWTSWYLHYTDIDEAIISENLNTFVEQKIPIDYFQIDDGWQRSIGEWECNRKFPNGLKKIVETAKANNIKAGLWLAPFIVEKDSNIFKNHPNWLLVDDNAKPIKIAYNPLWSGWFYALDFYNKEVRNYISGFLKKVVTEWDFSLLKLDFLYAVAVIPQQNKSRGTVMWEAMQWLRAQLPDIEILGCGVPLNSAFGSTDFCRIGPDISHSWDVKWLKKLHHSERLSTQNAIGNSIMRRQLDHLAFRNDPDVFLLRDEKQKLSTAQQFTLYLTNQIFGNLIFTSDDVRSYKANDRRLYDQQFPSKFLEIQTVKHFNKIVEVHFSSSENQFVAYLNLSDAEHTIEPAKGLRLFNQKDYQKAKPLVGNFALRKFESRVFVKEMPEKSLQVVQSDLHLFAGNGIAIEQVSATSFLIKKLNTITKGTVTLRLKNSISQIEMNGQLLDTFVKSGITFVRVEV